MDKTKGKVKPVKVRECYIAVPIDSDWGRSKKKIEQGFWLMAYSETKGAKRDAEAYGNHRIIKFREVKSKPPTRR